VNNIQWKIFRPSGLKYTEDCERQFVSWPWNETILMSNWQCSLVPRPTRRIGEKCLVPLFTYALSVQKHPKKEMHSPLAEVYTHIKEQNKLLRSCPSV